MNGYERMKAALDRKEPDRVPIMEWAIAPNVMDGIHPGCDNELDFADLMDLDGVNIRRWPNLEDADPETGSYVNEWGVVMQRTAESYAPVGPPITSRETLESYVPPDPDDEGNTAPIKEAMERFKGEKFITFHTRADFMTACEVHGMSELLMDFAVDPDMAHAVLKVVNDANCARVRVAADLGVDAITIADDWAFNTGPFMSPEHFREFVLPYFKKMIATCKEGGVYAIKHCDGNVWSLMDMTVDAGIDAFNPIEPAAGMNMADMKRKYGDRICLMGNIDCGHSLSHAPVAQVVGEVKHAIRDGGVGGGLVVMSSNSIHSSVRPENFKAMIETVQEFGRYPLDMAALA